MICQYCLKEIEEGIVECPFCKNKQVVETPPHRLLPGTVLNGRFVVGIAKGEGGFGITYIGRDQKLDRLVAIKEYYPTGYVNRSNTTSPQVTESSNDEEASFFKKGCERFLNEARILAKFSGEDGIVNVIDFFEENNTAYIVMEYIDGITLKEYLKEKERISCEETMRLLNPVMVSLERVHKQGLIHRDISPSNIMLENNGSVKLIDFGAAKDVSNVGNKSLSLMLKPGYAPEEQYRGRGQQGPWTDVYALSATIYKCITGVTPEEAIERMYSDSLKSPSIFGITIDPIFEKALMKGLSVFQKDRFQSVEDLLKGLKGEYVVQGTEAENTITITASAREDETETRYLNDSRIEDEKETEYIQKAQDRVTSSNAIINSNAHIAVENRELIKVNNDDAKRVDTVSPKSTVGAKVKNKHKLVICSSITAVIICVLISVYVINSKASNEKDSSNTVISSSSNNKRVEFSDAQLKQSDIDSLSNNSDLESLRFERCTFSNDTITSLDSINSEKITSVEIIDCKGLTDLNFISDFKNLGYLILRNSGVTDQNLKNIKWNQLTMLRKIDLSGNNAITNMEFLNNKAFTNLMEVWINDTAVRDISTLINERKELESLYASNCAVKSLSFKKNDHIKYLDLSHNSIENIESINHLTNLDTILLENNQISSLKPLYDIESLKILNVNKNKLDGLDGLEHAIRLEELYCNSNKISSLDGIENCTQLKIVDVSANNLLSISNLVKSKEKLQQVDLSNNRISDISCFEDAQNLTELSFDNNSVESIDTIKGCSNLRCISGGHNLIKSMKPLENLKQLRCISLPYNKITASAVVINSNERISVLDVSNNDIQNVTLGGSQSCTYLSVYNNPISGQLDYSSVSLQLLMMDYNETLVAKKIVDSNCKAVIVNCPMDKRVKVEEVYGMVEFVDTAKTKDIDTFLQKELKTCFQLKKDKD